LKKRIFSLSVVLALCVTGCDLFETSLADYLRDFPMELRLDSLQALHNSQIFYPLEAPEPGRDAFTIVVTPKTNIAITLHAAAADASSTVRLPLPWIIPSNPAPDVEGIQKYWKYRDNEKKQITVSAASGASKTYTVTIVWAKLIDNPTEINGDLSQDYYLQPGPPLELPADWLPIGAAADYTSYTAFSGSLRGNGRTVRIRGFKAPAGYAAEQGFFGTISRAWIEDIHIQLDAAVSTRAKNSGGLVGTATESVIQRVKVSGGIGNGYSGTETNVGGITGSSVKTVIRNSISTVNVSGTFSYTGSGNAWEYFYMGGIAGSQASGGYIFNSYAGGTVIAFSPATAGGVSGGGGRSPNHVSPNSNINFCVAVNAKIDASGGRADYILGQWEGPTGGTIDLNAHNHHQDNIVIAGSPYTVTADRRISGVPLTPEKVKTKSTYVSLGWDFNTVWKMNSYPALIWE
jgi:hypothetical protein